jgi:hypothetical protein
MNQLKDATRVLQRRPGVAIVIVAILGVGIGVTTSVFSLFHQILIRPLPVAEPEQLVNLSQAPFPVFSYPMFRDLEARQDVFAGLATYDEIPANLVYEGRARSGVSLAVSSGYFRRWASGARAADRAGDEPALDEPRLLEPCVLA